MGLDLLDTPVRLTWDLHGPGMVLSAAEMLAVAERIAAAGVFFVTLEERPLTHPAVAGVLERLTAGGCVLAVACTGSEAELAGLASLPTPLPAVQLDAAAFVASGLLDEERLRKVFARLRQSGVEPTLRLTPLKSNLHVIPRLSEFCQEFGGQRFKLPNVRIGDTFQASPPADLPRWADLEAFREIWTRQVPDLSEALQFEIHDRFLWEIITPGHDQARSEYGGCQAANSLGHVDAGGTVYACAAWPEPLGSLRDASLEDIWQSSARMAVRARVTRVPAGCSGCRDYSLCLGGCRGVGELLNQAGGGRDLMCRGPRQ
jgi:GeoRSP system SPASM domain protein